MPIVSNHTTPPHTIRLEDLSLGKLAVIVGGHLSGRTVLRLGWGTVCLDDVVTLAETCRGYKVLPLPTGATITLTQK